MRKTAGRTLGVFWLVITAAVWIYALGMLAAGGGGRTGFMLEVAGYCIFGTAVWWAAIGTDQLRDKG